MLTPLTRYEIAAARAHHELFPASLHGQQVYWTVVGVPAAQQKTIFDEWGNVEAFKSALADARAAEDQLRKVLVEGGWLQ